MPLLVAHHPLNAATSLPTPKILSSHQRATGLPTHEPLSSQQRATGLPTHEPLCHQQFATCLPHAAHSYKLRMPTEMIC